MRKQITAVASTLAFGLLGLGLGVLVTTHLSSGLGSPSVQGSPEVRVNEAGQTYGQFVLGDPATAPDLIEAIADDGSIGYIEKGEMFPELPDSVGAALEMSANADEPRSVPLFASDGETVIGTFTFNRASIGQ